MKSFDEEEARIEAKFGSDPEETSVRERIAAYANRGVDAPESLSLHEIRQVCYALVVHYTLTGII